MLTTSKTINISGYSQVNENSKPYVYFSASIDKTGTTNVSQCIEYKEIFSGNQDLFEADRKGFEDEVRKHAN